MIELPQLANVVKGEMSLVGPRPERPVFIEEFRKGLPGYMLRLRIPAGLTGWAQINYGYADDEADTVEKLTFDLYYVNTIVIVTMILGVQLVTITLAGFAFSHYDFLGKRAFFFFVLLH